MTNENWIPSIRELQLIYLQDLMGKIFSHELVPGGKSISVTNENRILSIREPGGKSINVTNENRIPSIRELQLKYLQGPDGEDSKPRAGAQWEEHQCDQ